MTGRAVFGRRFVVDGKAAGVSIKVVRDATLIVGDSVYMNSGVRRLPRWMPPDPGPQRTADETGYRRPRLDPFGQGVLFVERPALPEEVADPVDPLLVFDVNGE